MSIIVLKVALDSRRGTWRRIAIRDDQTLGDLHRAIFRAFDRFDEHLYTFYVAPTTVKLTRRTAYERAKQYSHPQALDAGGCWDAGVGGRKPPREMNAEQTTIGALRVSVGQVFLYLFDFGDEWWHVITVEQTNADADSALRYPAIIAQRGGSPRQYGEDEDEEA
jgi:hypothetical protein